MKKDPDTPLLVGRGFLATANAVIDCRMAKIAVGEGITRSIFDVKGVDLGEEEAPYWTTLGKRESYKPRPCSKRVGAQTPYYARKDFLDCHLPEKWEISRDDEVNPFKDTLVFRRMNVKEAMNDPAWIESMQEELLQFKRLDVWVLFPALDNISPLTLKWLFKNKYEYVSLSACFDQVLWMRTQLTDYGFYFNKILIYCDSKSTIAISCNRSNTQEQNTSLSATIS
nr:Gag-Pol polyprotein [Tanacetum cinerariifolium]